MNRLAQEAGLSQQSIAFIEDGRRKPTLDTLIRLCAVFQIPVSELLPEAEEKLQGP